MTKICNPVEINKTIKRFISDQKLKKKNHNNEILTSKTSILLKNNINIATKNVKISYNNNCQNNKFFYNENRTFTPLLYPVFFFIPKRFSGRLPSIQRGHKVIRNIQNQAVNTISGTLHRNRNPFMSSSKTFSGKIKTNILSIPNNSSAMVPYKKPCTYRNNYFDKIRSRVPSSNKDTNTVPRRRVSKSLSERIYQRQKLRKTRLIQSSENNGLVIGVQANLRASHLRNRIRFNSSISHDKSNTKTTITSSLMNSSSNSDITTAIFDNNNDLMLNPIIPTIITTTNIISATISQTSSSINNNNIKNSLPITPSSFDVCINENKNTISQKNDVKKLLSHFVSDNTHKTLVDALTKYYEKKTTE